MHARGLKIFAGVCVVGLLATLFYKSFEKGLDTYSSQGLSSRTEHANPLFGQQEDHPFATTSNIAQVTTKGTRMVNNVITGQFSLIDQYGKRRTNLDFRGRMTLVYFGYTFCPDICPQALSHISEALYQLKEKAKDVNAVFISIDPERDQVVELRRYLENFHPQIVALTGTPEEIKQAAQSFRVYFTKVNEESSSDYLMDHSSIIYVMDKRGRFITSFNHETSAQDIATTLLKLM
jgi:protein SCO1/2